jgi:hypothetical protein
MPAHVRASGTWRTLTNLYVRVSGSWRNVTEGYVKVSGTWRQFFGSATAPGQVTGLTATDFGTGRSFNNGRIDLLWSTPSDGGSPITGYFIEYSINGVTFFTLVSNTGTTSTSYTDTGLTSAQIYYYRVSAINAIGPGTASSAASATATTVPQTPTVSASVVSSTQVSLSFSGATGGKALSSLTITSSPSISLSYSGTSSPITVTGSYAVNQAYTFTMSATNANGTSGTSTASNSVTPNALSVPVNTGGANAPVVTPSSGTAGTTTFSCTTGTWSNSPTSYTYQWQHTNEDVPFANIPSATSSTYSPPSNYLSLYGASLRCRVTASNAAGSSTPAASNPVTVLAPLSRPSGGTVSLSGTGVAETTITATTVGWSDSPTSYSVRIYASTTNPPTTSGILKATNSPSSSNTVSYTVTTFDASPPPYYFKAFATATNAAGTSLTEPGSNVILSSLGAPSTPGIPTIIYDGGNSTPSNWAYDISWTASTGSGTIQYQLDCRATNSTSDPRTILSTATRPSSGLYSSTSQQDVLLSRIYTFWSVRARATNDGGTSWSAYSDWSLWA